MADAFTLSNRLRRQAVAGETTRAIITTRNKAEQDRREEERRSSREERAEAQFETQEELNDLKFEIMSEELRTTRSALDKETSFQAYKPYLKTGDPRFLNDLFRNNPRIRKAEAAGGPEIVSFQKIDLVNDKILIDQAIQRGIIDPDLFAEEESVKRYIKTTNSAGQTEIIDLLPAFTATGLFERLEDAELTKLERKVKIRKTEADITNILRGSKVAGANTTQAFQTAVALSEMTDEQRQVVISAATVGREAGLIPSAKAQRPRVFERKAGATAEIRDQLDQLDPKDPKQRRKGSILVSEMIAIDKQLAISSANEKRIIALNKLVSLGNIASTELKAKSTGFIDSAFINVRKYFSDNVGGLKGRTAYGAYRNVIRHVLFGTALTKVEIQSFREAFGDLKQQLGPVLEQFKVSLQTLRSDIDTVLNLEDPDVVKFRVGTSVEDVDNLISGIDSRLNAIQGFLLTGEDEESTGQIELQVTPASERIFTLEK